MGSKFDVDEDEGKLLVDGDLLIVGGDAVVCC